MGSGAPSGIDGHHAARQKSDGFDEEHNVLRGPLGLYSSLCICTGLEACSIKGLDIESTWWFQMCG